MNDDQLYPIGDVARRTGLSVSAIRFYADDGVITPTRVTDVGHRLYDVDAIARLELVRTLRELGAGLHDIRRLLAVETTLHDLATTHLTLVERQMRHLRARRAVLQTLVNQHTPTEQVTLMHKLVSLSDDDRNRLLDEFWDYVTDGLAAHPAFIESVHGMRPTLPADPTTEQLRAWIELAELVQDDAFRSAVRRFFHDSFSSPEAVALTAPPHLEQLAAFGQITDEAREAERSGIPPDSAQAREIADRYLAAAAGVTATVTGAPVDEDLLAELMGRLTDPSPTDDEVADRTAAEIVDLFGRYQSLIDTINGTSQPGQQGDGPSDAWIAAALTPSGPTPDR